MLTLPDPGPIAIIGAGGFGRECLDIVEALNRCGGELDFVGFLDDGDVDVALLERRKAALLGSVGAVSQYSARAVIALGDGRARATIDERLSASAVTSPVLVHPQATLGSECSVGAGTILNAGARVTTNVTLGRHVQVHANATVGHDAHLEDFVSIFPGATISGSVVLGRGVTIGTGANVLPGCRIGANSFVGAGAVVVGDVPAGVTVVGIPAHELPRGTHA